MTDRNQSKQSKPSEQPGYDNRSNREGRHPAQQVENVNYFNDEFESREEEKIGKEEAWTEKQERKDRK